VFSLVAVILFGGAHYTAYIRQMGDWYYYDDTKDKENRFVFVGKKVPASAFVKSANDPLPYMFFYSRDSNLKK
jgi:ubiquitin C-terminal hydrolase